MRADSSTSSIGNRYGRPGARLAIAALLLASPAAGVSVAAQSPQAPAEAVVRVSLGTDTVMPGDRAFLAVTLRAPDGARVGTTVHEIRFPAKWLTLDEVRTPADTPVTAKVGRPLNSAESTTVEVTLTANAGTTMSSGQVATVIFTVSKNVPVEQKSIAVENAVRVLTADTPPRTISAAGTPGTIEVSKDEPVAFGCFFYMH
jgi:hypothetical protein